MRICCPDLERELISKEFMDWYEEEDSPFLVTYEDNEMHGAQFINYCPFCGSRLSPRLPLKFSNTPRMHYLPWENQ